MPSPSVVAGTLSGRPEAVADDECDGEVGPARSSEEASEQGGLGCCGARGAKGRGQGECGSAKHGPDAEPGSRVTAQARIREAVIRNRQGKLTALLHHINIDVLRASFFGLKKTAAPGVDERTWIEYAEHLEANLLSLHVRVHSGAYRALPSRRKYIPKADGRQRPLGIAAIEDKIVQAAVMTVLTPIYELEFLGFSYGFRPKRVRSGLTGRAAFANVRFTCGDFLRCGHAAGRIERQSFPYRSGSLRSTARRRLRNRCCRAKHC